MQAALFRLLNGFSPTSIEAQTGSSLIRSKKAKNWDAYVRLWEEMSGTGENGLLDVLLANFREEYDRLMRGL
jgi:predicted component of type VI protein secretion system